MKISLTIKMPEKFLHEIYCYKHHQGSSKIIFSSFQLIVRAQSIVIATYEQSIIVINCN